MQPRCCGNCLLIAGKFDRKGIPRLPEWGAETGREGKAVECSFSLGGGGMLQARLRGGTFSVNLGSFGGAKDWLDETG